MIASAQLAARRNRSVLRARLPPGPSANESISSFLGKDLNRFVAADSLGMGALDRVVAQGYNHFRKAQNSFQHGLMLAHSTLLGSVPEVLDASTGVQEHSAEIHTDRLCLHAKAGLDAATALGCETSSTRPIAGPGQRVQGS